MKDRWTEMCVCVRVQRRNDKRYLLCIETLYTYILNRQFYRLKYKVFTSVLFCLALFVCLGLEKCFGFYGCVMCMLYGKDEYGIIFDGKKEKKK